MTIVSFKGWLTSKEVLGRTGISRATLNNYIKQGILPRPRVGPVAAQAKGPRQIGYFREDVIDVVETVKKLKRQGYSMQTIEAQFRQNTRTRTASLPAESQSTSVRPMTPAPFESEEKNLTLTINTIQSPAYLVNHNFEIEWLNPKAEEEIFHQPIRNITDREARNIFKLFLAPQFNQRIRNWEEIIEFHMSYMKPGLEKYHLHSLSAAAPQPQMKLLEQIFDRSSRPRDGSDTRTCIDWVDQDGVACTYQIYSLHFREGIFFVYVPLQRGASCGQDIDGLLSHRAQIIDELLKERMPSLVSLCVLVADLQDSVKISAEMLPSEYFEMINHLWRTLSTAFETHEGVYGKHAGDGMLYYFIKKPDSNYILNSIQCALELKERMREFSRSWQLRKGWLNDLFLNIGINEGQEFFGTIRSAANVEFTALGDSINSASRLSDFARSGAIWTTKNAIAKLDPQEIRNLRFGIRHRREEDQIFVQNSFSRLIDLLAPEDLHNGKFGDIAALPVTEIQQYRTQESRFPDSP